ncbi:hypothetical protein AUEXF2481DRAFT_447821 [Aureobasidium subglaciale EXF-2481]|uniref:Spindle pole body component n=1 Tax=Aureobasidium subglaciale (strain EXF-2481) TaxID=1043005 RepID=A0A074Y267_AURSE|nr:uncharacterized protein AUEXF2481DRAFT_447821 [Aureobasidium subglaciale EXF-2481]KAI5204104.1 hypothetical protein E4T38_04856 [Aureobasidium subglaciale]KAI5222810.1 hypothetical protein E4T40_04770 [Aureobasidium subglaciale]KAI5226588.1 hypothetical protein E4T41_04713 [Aureobasidium subglaciale]KAI5263130.1 hypothetical protein E4T46_03958 [Aureobasidium subglaciale]KEQ91898.1 hypothetical protein AUEXF2481DRAFT_447821 [Aureobasidium subglaciale EXF-2481]
MLHEVLIALSGHPSPLFPATGTSGRSGADFVDKAFPLLSSSEAALLATVGKLASLHRQIRDHANRIVSQHSSTICRAVAASLLQTHLARFREKILDVEKQILTKDAAIVGAYNIVPLSAVVGEFDGWSRRMDWYWRLACFIQPLDPKDAAISDAATGAGLIDHLRSELQTGFPDIETAATELSCVADKAWLKQVSVWLLYGLLPSHGAADFFVTVQKSTEGPPSYVLRRELLPKFVSRQTGSSLLFVGKSLHQVKQHTQNSSASQITHGNEDAALLNAHLQSLSSLSFPLMPATFSTAISSIRSSLSQKVLQRLLPPNEIKLVLNTFRQILLLDRGEFAVFLISEAAETLDARRVEHGRYLQEPSRRDLRGVMMKEGEVNESLSRTWKALTSLQTEDLEDEVLEFARENMRLEIDQGRATARPSTSDATALETASLTNTSFNDLLFPVPTSLTMHIRSPLDLFISRYDMDRYSALNAYLLSLRRAHMRLSNLWRESGSRRAAANPARLSPEAKQLAHTRSAAQRKVWATCCAAVFLLSETTAYFEGELITSSWDAFYPWATAQHHDPETLGRAHRAFLAALSYVILLTDAAYTRALRDLLTHIDALVALFGRLQRLQQTSSLDAGGATDFLDDEEAEVARELDRSRKRVDAALKDVVSRLRQLDHERLGAARYLQVEGQDSGFEVWRGGGVDRLLMKLDFGRMTGGDEYIV